jgi:transcriptional regulator with XRE-family HTH domain
MESDTLDNPLPRDLEGVAERLRLAREHGGLSQQAFADRVGCTRRQVISWETAVSAPPIWAVLAVRRLCDVDPEWVMAGPGKTPLRHAIPQNDDRTLRLATEVAAMAADVGLKLDAPIVASLAQQIAREPPEAERDAKRQTLAMLRAIALGKVTRL